MLATERKKSKLIRETFRTSREMDFFSEKELITQTGHDVQEWPLVFVKETLDNALDAADDADIAPVIDVTADEAGITVRDNGPGLPEATLKAQLDFTTRASNREAYVAPDRGQQGNALKTLLPMARVIDPDHGKFIVQAHGKRHILTCGADPISQRAVVNDDETKRPTSGTEIRIEWQPRKRDDGVAIWPFKNLYLFNSFRDRFKDLVLGFAVFNSHATINFEWFGEKETWPATNPTWEKWKPCYPTSAHWYELQHLERLVGAFVTKDREAGAERLASDFIAGFDGLTGSQKRAAVLEETGLKRVKLSEFVVNGRLDSKRIGKLLRSMQIHTRPVTPRRLGILGEEHLKTRLLAMGAQPESFRYSKKLSEPKCKNLQSGDNDKPRSLPGVLESAFGFLGAESTDSRRIFSGANWSAAIRNPFRSFGTTGEGLETALADMRATRDEPIIFVLHLAQPRIAYTDRGKSALVIGGVA